jgi:hypothetical protein
MSESERSGEEFAGAIDHFPGGFIRASRLNQDNTLTPREEPYVEPTYLNKPILDVYDAGGELEHKLLEEPDSGVAWIRAHENQFVNVEGNR